MESRGRPYHALRHREFRRFATGMFVSLVGSHMQNAAIDWHVWTLTKSPLLLGMVGLSRVIPIVAFSLLGGVVADRYDRRRVLVTTQVLMMTSASLLASLKEGIRFVFSAPSRRTGRRRSRSWRSWHGARLSFSGTTSRRFCAAGPWTLQPPDASCIVGTPGALPHPKE